MAVWSHSMTALTGRLMIMSKNGIDDVTSNTTPAAILKKDITNTPAVGLVVGKRTIDKRNETIKSNTINDEDDDVGGLVRHHPPLPFYRRKHEDCHNHHRHQNHIITNLVPDRWIDILGIITRRRNLTNVTNILIIIAAAVGGGMGWIEKNAVVGGVKVLIGPHHHYYHLPMWKKLKPLWNGSNDVVTNE